MKLLIAVAVLGWSLAFAGAWRIHWYKDIVRDHHIVMREQMDYIEGGCHGRYQGDE
jgi:hypothetical protein